MNKLLTVGKKRNKEEKGYNEIEWNDYRDLIKDMTFFDPHIHIGALTSNDYHAMADAGIVAIIEPAFRLRQPRLGAAFKDYNSSLAEWERFRSSQFGIKHYCTVGLNSKEANNEELADLVMAILPLYLRKEGVVGVGDIGFENQTKSEEKYFRLQLELAKKNKLPIQIRTPHRDKKRATQLSIDICKEHEIDNFMVIFDHNNEETIKNVLDKGFWASLTLCPAEKMGNERVVEMIQQYGSEKIMLNSTTDAGISDSLAVPKAAALMKMKGMSNKDIKKITYQNAIDAFGQSGQIYIRDFQKTKTSDKKIAYNGNGIFHTTRLNQNAQEDIFVSK